MSLGRDRCPTCGVPFEFVTSGALSQVPGVVTAKHAPGPCVPRVEKYESDCDRDCDGCGAPFEKVQPRQRYCAGCQDRCRVEYQREWRRARKGVAERCVCCPYCYAVVWTKRRRQVTCLSADCQAAHKRSVSLLWWYEKRKAA